jgi:hypothetical protein
MTLKEWLRAPPVVFVLMTGLAYGLFAYVLAFPEDRSLGLSLMIGNIAAFNRIAAELHELKRRIGER